jgi:hypothetical protein
MTALDQPTLEDEARAMFEQDPSSKFEADWDNLAEYKRDGWRTMAHTARQRAAS